MNDYIIGAGLLLGWVLISGPSGAQSRFIKELLSWAIAGGCVWFGWWVFGTHCAGGC